MTRRRSSWRREDVLHSAVRMMARGRRRVNIGITSTARKASVKVCEKNLKHRVNILVVHLLTCLAGRIQNIAAKVPLSDVPEKESTYSQCSPCWSEEQPSPPQLYCTQTCLRPPAELPLPLSNSLSHAPLHTKSNGVIRNRQRRGVRLKVKGKKSTIRMWAHFSTLTVCELSMYVKIVIILLSFPLQRCREKLPQSKSYWLLSN